jgi:hypothetical protein
LITCKIGSKVRFPRDDVFFWVMLLGMAEMSQCESVVLPLLNGELRLVTNNDMEPAPGFVTGTPSECDEMGQILLKS